MRLRVGRIPFLVCAPFFQHFFTKNFQNREDSARLEFIDGVPSRLNGLLAQGNIHLAPGSSFNFAMHPEELVLAPNLCTSCNLEVQSVKLFSRLPIEQLGGRRIHLTSQSATSIALLKILFKEYIGETPEYVSGVPFCNFDSAKLLIGDEALLENKKNDFPYSYDLGTLWQLWQHMPFVFGAWSIHKSATVGELKSELTWFLEKLEYSVEEFRKNPRPALEGWMEHYPCAVSPEDLKAYYSVLDYSFTDQRKESLSRFFELAAKVGLLKKAPALKFF